MKSGFSVVLSAAQLAMRWDSVLVVEKVPSFSPLIHVCYYSESGKHFVILFNSYP